MLVHNVFFALKDTSDSAWSSLIAACNKYLTKHSGIVFFAAGKLAAELNRPVNDRDFDVALHIGFQTQADHDRYQVAPDHEKFVAENKDGWSKVRVFDSITA